jgi:hypothetical protein
MISFSVSKVNPSHLAALQSSLLGGDLLGGTRFEEAEKLAEMLTERVLGTFFDDSGEAAPVRARPSTGASQDSRRLRSEAQAVPRLISGRMTNSRTVTPVRST